MILMIFELMKIVIKIKKLPLILLAVVFLAASSFIIHWIEPETFDNPFIGLWFVMTTVTTTGYGDYVPYTIPGKIFSLFLYFFGIGLIGIVIGKIVEGFDIYQKLKEEGKLQYKDRDHYVIVGWSNKAKHTISEILELDEQAKILIIDSLVKTPFTHEKVSFLQGDVTDKETLEKANILESKAALIFSPDNEFNSVAADGQSLLLVSTIESYATEMKSEIYTIVEILKKKHISNFEHANVDEFILADEALSDIMAKSAVDKGSSKLIMELLSTRRGVDIRKIKKKKSWSTYNDAFEDLKVLGANLIADRDDFNLLTKLGEHIPDEAELFVICSKDAYEKIIAASS